MSRIKLIVLYKLVCDSVETIRWNIIIDMYLNITKSYLFWTTDTLYQCLV